MNQPDDIRKHLQMAQIIQGAGIISVFLYAGVATMLHLQKFQYAMRELESVFRIVFPVLGIATLAFLPILRWHLLRTKGSEDLKTLLTKLRIVSIASMALCETPAIYGLCLHLTTGNIREAAFLGAIGLIALVAWFPTEADWTAYLQRVIVDRQKQS